MMWRRKQRPPPPKAWRVVPSRDGPTSEASKTREGDQWIVRVSSLTRVVCLTRLGELSCHLRCTTGKCHGSVSTSTSEKIKIGEGSKTTWRKRSTRLVNLKLKDNTETPEHAPPHYTTSHHKHPKDPISLTLCLKRQCHPIHPLVYIFLTSW